MFGAKRREDEAGAGVEILRVGGHPPREARAVWEQELCPGLSISYQRGFRKPEREGRVGGVKHTQILCQMQGESSGVNYRKGSNGMGTKEYFKAQFAHLPDSL